MSLSYQAFEWDERVRLAAFSFLAEQTRIHGDVLLRDILQRGFEIEGKRVPLISPQGIFTPKVLEIPLTFCTVPPTIRNERPYEDEIGTDGCILYRYRGTDLSHRDNVGMRRAMQESRPLIYLYGIVPGTYLPIWPVYIVGDDNAGLTFRVSVDTPEALVSDTKLSRESDPAPRRRYITIETQRRMHQQGFRLRVMRAYQQRCAICQLRHVELLEAAHILPDGHPRGDPVIPNGISLCKLHHAAYDANIFGIRPDCIIEVRDDVLREHDGPMLLHGLKEIDAQVLHLPHHQDLRPDAERLEIRYEAFRKAC